MKIMRVRGRRGFTLIELLVVIAIVGLLASIVLASLGSARDSARYTAVAAELNQTEKAFFALFLQRGCWPREGNTGCSGVAAADPTIATLLGTSAFGLQNYISRAPSWPFSSSQWQYDNDGDVYPSPCTAYSQNGVKIYVSTTIEHYRAMNTIVDGDANPDSPAAMGCGKILWNGGAALGYLLSPTQ